MAVDAIIWCNEPGRWKASVLRANEKESIKQTGRGAFRRRWCPSATSLATLLALWADSGCETGGFTAKTRSA
jgi:hypothetical protein